MALSATVWSAPALAVGASLSAVTEMSTVSAAESLLPSFTFSEKVRV